MNDYYSPVGYTASGPRNIKDGSQYESYFPQIGNVTDTLAKANGSVIDTVHSMAGVIKKYLNEKKISRGSLKAVIWKQHFAMTGILFSIISSNALMMVNRYAVRQ